MKVTSKQAGIYTLSWSNQKDHESENIVLPDVSSVEVVHLATEKQLGKAAARVELEESQTEPWEEMEV